jgi:hypothetical protein
MEPVVNRRYEVVFSMTLRDDVSVETLHELHWQLGLGATRPEFRVVSDEPVLTPQPVARRRASEEMVALQRQYKFVGERREHDGWALHTRLYWPAERFARSWWQTANWLAANAADDGYAGFYRRLSAEQPNVFIVRDGRAYLSESGRQPGVLTAQP